MTSSVKLSWQIFDFTFWIKRWILRPWCCRITQRIIDNFRQSVRHVTLQSLRSENQLFDNETWNAIRLNRVNDTHAFKIITSHLQDSSRHCCYRYTVTTSEVVEICSLLCHEFEEGDIPTNSQPKIKRTSGKRLNIIIVRLYGECLFCAISNIC